MPTLSISDLRPKLTPTQLAAIRREDQAMFEKYPGQYVAYLDDWNGVALTRTVVVTTADVAEFHRSLKALAPDIRKRVQMTLLPHADSFSATSAFLT